MAEAETILKIIETVDPADKAKLDEIDDRVWFWVHRRPYIGLPPKAFFRRFGYSIHAKPRRLEESRPDRWWPRVDVSPRGHYAACMVDMAMRRIANLIRRFYQRKNSPNSTPSFRLSNMSADAGLPMRKQN